MTSTQSTAPKWSCALLCLSQQGRICCTNVFVSVLDLKSQPAKGQVSTRGSSTTVEPPTSRSFPPYKKCFPDTLWFAFSPCTKKNSNKQETQRALKLLTGDVCTPWFTWGIYPFDLCSTGTKYSTPLACPVPTCSFPSPVFFFFHQMILLLRPICFSQEPQILEHHP